MIIYYEHQSQFQIIYTNYINKNNILKECSNGYPIVFKSPKKIISNMILPSLTGDWKTYSSSDFFCENKVQPFPFYLSSSTIIPYAKTDLIFTQDNYDKLPIYFCNMFDEILKSPCYIHSCYDISFGFKNAIIPLNRKIMYKRYIYVASGNCSIKLTNWKSTYFIRNKMHYFATLPTYFCNTNVWNKNNKLENIIEFKTINLNVGEFLFIPSYWWSSIYFDDDTVLIDICYDTIGNKIAHANEWIKSYKINWTSDINNQEHHNINLQNETINNNNNIGDNIIDNIEDNKDNKDNKISIFPQKNILPKNTSFFENNKEKELEIDEDFYLQFLKSPKQNNIINNQIENNNEENILPSLEELELQLNNDL